MKSLKTYLFEKLVKESEDSLNYKFFRFDLNKYEDLKDSISKITSAAEKDGYYSEITDGGCKIKVTSGSTPEHLIDACNAIIEDNKDKEGLDSAFEKIKSVLSAIEEYTKPAEEEKKEEKSESEENKSDDSEKSEEE